MGGFWRAPEEGECGLGGCEEVWDAEGRHWDVRTLEVRVRVHKCMLDVLGPDVSFSYRPKRLGDNSVTHCAGKTGSGHQV